MSIHNGIGGYYETTFVFQKKKPSVTAHKNYNNNTLQGDHQDQVSLYS